MTGSTRTSRRALLGFGALTLGAAALAACGGAPLPTPVIPTQPPAKPTEVPKPAATAAPAGGAATPAAGATAAGATTAAAQATTAPAAAQAATGGTAAITLRMHSRTDAEGTKPQAAIKVLEAKNPKVHIQLEMIPTADYVTKILALAAGGQVGDLMWGSPTNYHIQVGTGLWFDVTPLIQSTKYDMAPFFQSAKDYLTRHDGKYWSLPYKAHPGAPALWYNKEMLDAAGVGTPNPKTFDELTDLAVKLTKRSSANAPADVYGFLPNDSYDHASLCDHRSWGAEEVDPIFSAKKSLMDQDKSLQVYTWLHSLYWKHKVAPAPGPGVGVGQDVWVAQKSAMYQASSSTKSVEGLVKGKWTPRVVLMPPGPSGKVGTKLVFDNFGMYKQTKYPNEAFDVLGYFCGKEHGIRLGLPEGGGSWTCGARTDVFYSDELMNSTPNHKVFAEITEKSDPSFYPDNFRLNEYSTALTQGYQKIMLNETPPTAATMKEFQQSLQAVLDRPKP